MIKNKEKHKSKNKGITLIALVITIIVLLILAGVSIAMLTGSNGILTQAQNASKQTEKASLIEQVQMDILGEQANGNSSGIGAGTLQTILNKYFSNVPEDANDIKKDTSLKATEEYGGYEITLSEIYNGKIIVEQKPIELGTSYIANFADMDGDGTADGIIYADLSVGGSGQWTDSNGTYEYSAKTGLKEYYIENENYTEPKFGNASGKLIAPIEGSSGENRFYVMALEDVNTGTIYCWYDAAFGEMNDYASTTSQDFGTGEKNTETMIAKWDAEGYGAKNDGPYYDDMWGVEELRNKVKEGWFVPSRAEWSAFGNMATKTLGLTTSNYRTYGLRSWYWSSSQSLTSGAYGARFDYGYILANGVSGGDYVRLSATF